MLVCCAAGQSQTTRPIDPETAEKLQRIDERAAGIEDLVAEFTQEKHSALLKRPLISRGVVRAKGSVMLWQTTVPQPTMLRIDSSSLQLLYLDQKVLEIYPIDGKLAQLASSPLPRLSSIQDQFSIDKVTQTGDALTIILTPRTASLKQNVDFVHVVIDTTQGVVTRLELTDPDGDKTITRFENVRLNTGLNPSSLELLVPKGTKIVHPLQTAL